MTVFLSNRDPTVLVAIITTGPKEKKLGVGGYNGGQSIGMLQRCHEGWVELLTLEKLWNLR